MSTGDDILSEARARRAAIAAEIPDAQAAIDTMYRGYSRLRDLGWRDGIYMPKDGTMVTVMQCGSTGTFDCSYSGEWPDGYFHLCDGGDVYPQSGPPPLFKPKTT